MFTCLARNSWRAGSGRYFDGNAGVHIGQAWPMEGPLLGDEFVTAARAIFEAEKGAIPQSRSSPKPGEQHN